MTAINYKKIFNPHPFLQDFRTDKDKEKLTASDRRDGKLYQYNENIVLAINVAMATGRPLLVRGKSGSGKSSLAYNAARVLGRRFYQFVVTSRTKSQDLLWRFDAVRRLGDAQARSFAQEKNKVSNWHNYYPYIEPEVLWWVFDPVSAGRRGLPESETLPSELIPKNPATYNPDKQDVIGYTPAVVLIDEIDKAGPDFPNNLLIPFGSQEFRVDEISQDIKLSTPVNDKTLSPFDLPLIFITTNEERRLPDAFLRRCIILELVGPNDEQLVEIAMTSEGDEYADIYREIVRLMRSKLEDSDELASYNEDSLEDMHLNVAEYLDAVRAYLRLKGSTDNHEQLLQQIIKVTSQKRSF